MNQVSGAARIFALGLILLAIRDGIGCAAAGADEVPRETPFHRNTPIRFADTEEGIAILTNEDRFLRSISAFDIDSRVGESNARRTEYIKLLQTEVVDWSADQVQSLLPALESVRLQLAPYRLPLPEKLYLIQTTGREEGNAAYCRGPAIVLPTSKISQPQPSLVRVLLHELFHIISSHNPDLRYELFREIGFDRIDPADVRLPDALADRKITNPDAPELDCVLYVTDDDGGVGPAIPLIRARAPYRAGSGSFFGYMDFRLLRVRREDDHWVPVLNADGEPLLLNPERPELFWNIGINTRYILHPEEVLADNFMYMVLDRPVATPRIIAALERRFGDR